MCVLHGFLTHFRHMLGALIFGFLVPDDLALLCSRHSTEDASSAQATLTLHSSAVPSLRSHPCTCHGAATANATRTVPFYKLGGK